MEINNLAPTPEEQLVERLISKNEKIAFAESCTGGLLPARLIGVANASKVIEASVVTYANSAKIKYASVAPTTIEAYNVVSTEVAAEMAQGIAINTGADIAASTTGYAGPGSDETHIFPDGTSCVIPVGTVCFGFYIRGNVCTFTQTFSDMTRNEVRSAAADFVFNKLLELV